MHDSSDMFVVIRHVVSKAHSNIYAQTIHKDSVVFQKS